ncbi:MAG: hypothetical protein AAFX02_05320 [Pseudomonadota bacterium]
MSIHQMNDQFCQCQSEATSVPDRLTASEHWLNQADATFGETLFDALLDGACGEGELAGRVESLGVGADALRRAEPGDVIISMGLFPEADPKIELVGYMSSDRTASLIESLEDQEPFEVLRLAENPFAAGTAGAAVLGALGPGVGSGIGTGIGNLITDPTAPIRGGIQTANAALDLASRVYRIASRVRNSFRGLRFSGSGLSYASGYTPVNARTKTNAWRFELRCKYSSGSSSFARYPFQVVVNHDCFNIFDAQIIPLSPTIAWYTGNHELQVTVTPMSRTMGNSIPPRARFRISGTWDPADILGQRQEQFLGYVIVSANGQVTVQGLRGDLVRPTRVSAVSGPSVGACTTLYNRFRQTRRPPQPTAPAPSGPVPGAGGGGRRRPTRRPSRGAYRPRGAPPNPVNGVHVFFRTGSSRATSEIRSLIQRWWTGLRPNIQLAIGQGRIAVRVKGHADPTGAEARNRALSHRRAAMVAGLVRAQAGAGANVQFAGVGSDDARRAGVPSGQSDRTWRRVTVTLDTGGPLQ